MLFRSSVTTAKYPIEPDNVEVFRGWQYGGWRSECCGAPSFDGEVDVEQWVSECCDSPPLGELEWQEYIDTTCTGTCGRCKDHSVFVRSR